MPALERPMGIPERFDEHVKLMFDLQWLAFQGDITRVVTFMFGRELNSRTYPEIGVTEAHHGLSHHRDDPEQLAKLREAEHVSVRAVRGVPREAAGHAGRRRHAARSLAVPVRRRPEQSEHPFARRPSDRARRRRLGPAEGRPAYDGAAGGGRRSRMSNLLLSVIDKSGIAAERFGDSTGRSRSTRPRRRWPISEGISVYRIQDARRCRNRPTGSSRTQADDASTGSMSRQLLVVCGLGAPAATSRW